MSQPSSDPLPSPASPPPEPSLATPSPAPPAPPGEVTLLKMGIQAQPDDVTCGPTCLHAVYKYFGDELPLSRMIEEIDQLGDGGTLAPLLGSHALRRGYRAWLYTFDLRTFDPTWLTGDHKLIPAKLRAQMQAKTDAKLHTVSRAYLDFLELGGQLRFEDLTRPLIRRILNRHLPILVGLSSTYLYREAREIPASSASDDIAGLPAGHFVVLHGYDPAHKLVSVVDPYADNPLTGKHGYALSIDRVICAILLGIVTYDANLLVIEPKSLKKGLS